MTTEPDSEQQADSQTAQKAGGAADLQDAGAKAKEIMRRLGPAGVLAIIAATLPLIGGFTLLGTIKWTGPWLAEQGSGGIAIYIGGFTLLAGLALLPTYAQAVLAGFAFKFARGTGAALAGILGASVIGYLIARRASGNRVVELIEEQPKWRAVYDALLRSGPGKALLIVTLLRIPTNSPFAITNLVMAACRIPLVTYVVGTVVGIAPRTALAVYIGSKANTLDFSKSSNLWFFIGGIIVTIIVAGIIGLWANKVLAKVTNQHPETTGSDRDGA